jgi:LPXTG-motif cell wall-anchored protein
MANVPVIIKDCRDNIVARSVTDADGKVIVPNLPDGTYTVSSGDVNISLHGSMTIDSGKTSSVTLEGSRVSDSSLAGNTSGSSVPSISSGGSTNVTSTISSASNIQSASESSAEEKISSSNASALENRTNNEVPKTGQSGVMPAIALTLMAVCGTAGVLFSRKKDK